MYKILGADKKEYGPVSAEVLRQWIADRRANAQTLVQSEGSNDWRPLAELTEFAGAFSAPPPPQPPPTPPSAPSPFAVPLKMAKTSAMAITSLILGICGVITCFITPLIGLVLGIVSLLQIRKSNGQISGQGIAIAGICVSGAFLLFAPIGVAVMLPAIAKAKMRAETIKCTVNLKQIGLATLMWANDHNGTFPPQLAVLTNEISSPAVFACPGDAHAQHVSTWADFTQRDISYEYLGAGEKTSNPQTQIARCPIHGNVLFADGHVQQGR